MTGQEFLHLLADQLVSELRPNEAIKKFTSNPAVIGAYAEASLRRFVERVVFPLRVSTGAVIDEKLCSKPQSIPQLDIMIWSPSPAPAIFNVGDFGLVPRSSCFGIMEIKRTDYKNGVKDMAEKLQVQKIYNLVANTQDHVTMQPDIPPGIGVICIKRKKGANSKVLEDLIQKGLVVILFDETSETGLLKPNTEAIHKLLNFLIATRLRAKIMDGMDLVNISVLLTENQAPNS